MLKYESEERKDGWVNSSLNEPLHRVQIQQDFQKFYIFEYPNFLLLLDSEISNILRLSPDLTCKHDFRLDFLSWPGLLLLNYGWNLHL